MGRLAILVFFGLTHGSVEMKINCLTFVTEQDRGEIPSVCILSRAIFRIN